MADNRTPMSFLENADGERVYFDAVTSRSLNYTSTVPEYPTEAGYKVSDAVIAALPSFEIEGVLSMMSSKTNTNASTVVQAVLAKLMEFYYNADLLKYYYGGGMVNPFQKRVNNLVIESMSFPEESSYGKAVQVRLVLKQMQFPKMAVTYFKVSTSYDLGGSSSAVSDAHYGSSGVIHGGGGGKYKEDEPSWNELSFWQKVKALITGRR